MQTGTEKIIRYKVYSCGYCHNSLKNMYKGIKSGKGHAKIEFPARVLLVEHRERGLILVDTGYGPGIYARGFVTSVYNRVNPAFFSEDVSIRQQLIRDGIQPEQVKQIILTHMHPDHIGGAGYFPDAKFILSERARQRLMHPRLRDLQLTGMADVIRKSRLEPVSCNGKTPLEGFSGTDYFGDGSLWLMALEGHAYGHIGVYIPERALFYIADATWTIEHMSRPLTPLARQIQQDIKAYEHTLRKLSALKSIRLLCAHGEAEVTEL